MIPKVIHYCWFGRNPKPKLAEKCIKSWKKYCPDYEIIEWNEDNYDISAAPLYVRQAYEAKKWAFVTDYVRLKVVYEYGGIYLDTDVELINPIDQLLNYHAYFGFEDSCHINTGHGFGSEKGEEILHQMMLDYDNVSFVLEDGSFDLMPCPQRNSPVFKKFGFHLDNTLQVINNCAVFPKDYFSPVEYSTGHKNITQNTLSIHWFGASWHPEELKHKRLVLKRKQQRANLIHNTFHMPNRIAICILGKERYEKIKRILKRR